MPTVRAWSVALMIQKTGVERQGSSEAFKHGILGWRLADSRDRQPYTRPPTHVDIDVRTLYSDTLVVTQAGS
jgi:hypothetical protein